MMARIGLVIHKHREAAAELGRDLVGWLADAGHEVLLTPSEASLIGYPQFERDDAAFGSADFIVSLGGDGSMLRAFELVGEADIPILGIDLGELGYLTQVQPGDAKTAIDRVVAGDFEVDERMLLSIVVRRDGEVVARELALNEVVVERSGDANTIRVLVDVDGEFFTSYAADGLIVATPTGSTAYSFSAGGPIVPPSHQALLLTPVSPHQLFDRSLVFSPDTTLRLSLDGHRAAAVSVDGRRVALLHEGDHVECTGASRSARLVALEPRYFHRVLKAKFGLHDR